MHIDDYPTCKTCGFYEPAVGTRDSWCKCPRVAELVDDKEAGDFLTYPYNEGGYMIPGPNFGCIHHTGIARGR